MSFFRKRKIEKLLSKLKNEDKSIKLHVGCGRNYKDGWINIDNRSRAKKDISLYLRRVIPFPDNSIDFIYNEHFIEHLSYDYGFCFLKESYRILKPGGVIRTAFPDLDTLIDSYLKDYWRQMEWVKLIKAQWYPSGCFMLNKCLREGGLHLYMYNLSELTRRLIEAGFGQDKIYDCKVNQSSYPELREIEKRTDSTVVEAVK